MKFIYSIFFLAFLSTATVVKVCYAQDGVKKLSQQTDEHSSAEEQFNLGVAYDYGNGVTEDDREAVKWYRLAAEQGYAVAQYNLGLMLYKGRGVTQDEGEAVKWFRLAAEQGYADAQFNLGIMFANGSGVTQDVREAVKWYRLAAEQGHAVAQFNLGIMFANGEGVIEDDVLAYMWINIASSNDAEPAAEARSVLKKRMTREQIAEAQRRARACVEKNYKGC